jgi:hypothetical protein
MAVEAPRNCQLWTEPPVFIDMTDIDEVGYGCPSQLWSVGQTVVDGVNSHRSKPSKVTLNHRLASCGILEPSHDYISGH